MTHKQCIALFFCGLLMVGVAATVSATPVTFRFRAIWAERVNFQLLVAGLILSGYCGYVYLTKNADEA